MDTEKAQELNMADIINDSPATDDTLPEHSLDIVIAKLLANGNFMLLDQLPGWARDKSAIPLRPCAQKK